MNNVCNFLNDKSLIILTSVISSLTTLVVVFLFKSFVLKAIKLAAIKSKAYVKKLYRWHKGKPTIKELMDIERRQKAGKSLTKKEEKLLLDFHEQLKQVMSKSNFNNIQKRANFENLPSKTRNSSARRAAVHTHNDKKR